MSANFNSVCFAIKEGYCVFFRICLSRLRRRRSISQNIKPEAADPPTPMDAKRIHYAIC